MPTPYGSAMDDEPLARLPDRVLVTLDEFRVAAVGLDAAQRRLRELGVYDVAEQVDAVLRRMLRWLWDDLRWLDEEG